MNNTGGRAPLTRRYSTTGLGSADASSSFAPTTPGRAAKRMPESLMALKKESNSRKYDIGVLATPGRKKLPVLAGGLANSMAGGLAGSKAPAFCTPTRQRNDAAGINRQRRATMAASKPMALNLDDSDPSLDDDDERPPDLRRGLRGSRTSLAATRSSLSERRMSLSMTKGAPSNRKLISRSKSHSMTQGGLDSKSDHIPRHSFTRPSITDHNEDNIQTRIRRRMSLGGPGGSMRRASTRQLNIDEGADLDVDVDLDVDDDISIDDTVGDAKHSIAAIHTPRGAVKKRNTLVCTMPNRADILPAPSTPGKKASTSARPNLGEHGKSPSKRGSKLSRQASVEKMTSPTKREDKQEKGPDAPSTPGKKASTSTRPNLGDHGKPSSKRVAKQSSIEKTKTTSPTNGKDKKVKGPNKNIVAEIDAMDISAISVDADLDLGYGDDNTGENPDDKPKLRRSKSSGSAGSNGKIKARISAVQNNNKKQGEAQSIPADVEETTALTEGELETTQAATTEASVPSKSLSSLSSSRQEIIAVEVSPVVCNGGSVILRPPSDTWSCTCGHTADKSDKHCGMCGTKQLWTCIECMYTENLCIYSFCTSCGTKKVNFLEQANAQAKSEPAAPYSPSSVQDTP